MHCLIGRSMRNRPEHVKPLARVRIVAVLRRLLVWGLVAAIGGSCMTILVAWICAATIYVYEGGSELSARPGLGLSCEVYGRPGAMRVESYIYEPEPERSDYDEGPFDLPSWGRAAQITNRPEPLAPAEVHEDARGWPLLALWCRLDHDWYPGMPFRLTGGGLQLPPHGNVSFRLWRPVYEDLGTDEMRALPLRPVWSGFLLDAAFYGMLCVLIGAVACWARRLVWPLGNLAYRLRRWLLLPCLAVLTVWMLWILAPFVSHIPSCAEWLSDRLGADGTLLGMFGVFGLDGSYSPMWWYALVVLVYVSVLVTTAWHFAHACRSSTPGPLRRGTQVVLAGLTGALVTLPLLGRSTVFATEEWYDIPVVGDLPSWAADGLLMVAVWALWCAAIRALRHWQRFEPPDKGLLTSKGMQASALGLMAAVVSAGYVALALEWLHEQWWMLLCYDPDLDALATDSPQAIYSWQDRPTLWRAAMLVGFCWVLWTLLFLFLKQRLQRLAPRFAVLAMLTVASVLLLILAILARFEFDLVGPLLAGDWRQLEWLVVDAMPRDDRSIMDHSSYTAAVLAMTVIVWSLACALLLLFHDYREFRATRLVLC